MRLFRYLGRKFLLTFLMVFGVFFGILVLIDLVEQVRKSAGSGASLGQSAVLALLNAPQGLYQILPLVMLFAGIALFLSLARTSELVVVRAVGVSALRALVAPVSGAVLFGLLTIMVLNPMVTATSRKYDELSRSYRNNGQNILSVSQEGLWLRQGGDGGQWVIRAARANADGTHLFGATFLGFGADGAPDRRIEAREALLGPGAWELTDARDWPLTAENPELEAQTHARLTLSSELTAQEIRDSFEEPSAIGFWELPDFIRKLERAGFSSRYHQVWFQMALATPVFFVAMLLTGGAFTMRHTRLGKTGVMVLAAVLCGFLLFFLRNFAQVLGENAQIPVLLAAWGPPVAGVLFSLGLLLHMEDG